MGRVVGLGIAASFFFAFTFVLNRQMNLGGGSWVWSGVLRFLFMLPMLSLVVLVRREWRPVLRHIAGRPLAWLGWSTVGFGLFYAPLCAASVWGPSWLLAASWQITIIAGALLSPLFFQEARHPGEVRVRHRLPLVPLAWSSLILAGVALLQWQESAQAPAPTVLAGLGLVVIAAFAYPLGNRKMMQVTGTALNTTQRVFGMTLCSLPFWLALGAAGLAGGQMPDGAQLVQSANLAHCSGVIATLLFFKATNLVKHDLHRLAVVESTQAGEVVFTVLGGVLLFGDRRPDFAGFAGLGLVVLGMVMNSLSVGRKPKGRD